jgi:hypothetical protein
MKRNKKEQQVIKNFVLFEVRNKETGELHRVYLDGAIEGFEGFTVVNFATPFIRPLLHQLSLNQTSKSLVPLITGLIDDPSGFSQGVAE